MKGMLRKVSLLLTLYVETIEVPIDLGEYFAILKNFFVTSLYFLTAFFFFFVTDMSSFKENLCTRSN